MTVTKRELDTVRVENSKFVAFVRALAPLLAPLLKRLWRIGPVGRWAQRSVGGRVGTISRLAKSGQHEKAGAMAIEALKECRRAPERRLVSSNREFWWFFAQLAAENLSAAGDREGMERLIETAREGVPPFEGYSVAQTYLAFSRWKYSQKDYEAAFEFAQQAADADASWAEPEFVLGWYCLVLGREGAGEHLARAVEIEPEIYPRIAKDPVCRRHPHITARLKRLVDEAAARGT